MWSNYLEQNVRCAVQHGPVGQSWSMESVGTAVQKRHSGRARALLCGLRDTRDGDDPPRSDPFVFHIHRTSWLLPQKLSRRWLFDHTHTQLHFDTNTQAVHQKVRSQSSQSRGLWLKKKHVSRYTFSRLDTRLFHKRGTADRRLIQRTFELIFPWARVLQPCYLKVGE